MARRYQPKHARTTAAPESQRRRAPDATPRRSATTRRDEQPSGPRPAPTATTPASLQPAPDRSPAGTSVPTGAERHRSDPTVVRTTKGRRQRALVRAPSPFPAREETTARPAWWMRLRGLVGVGMLVTVGGVLVAVAVGIVLVLLVIAAVATLA
jgi:hypothetical protein